VELQAEALDRIARAEENDWRRFLLGECLQAYSDLDPAEWERLQALLITDKYKEARPMTLTYYERGKLQGELTALREMTEGTTPREVRTVVCRPQTAPGSHAPGATQGPRAQADSCPIVERVGFGRLSASCFQFASLARQQRQPGQATV
jgi:hypothetical protein